MIVSAPGQRNLADFGKNVAWSRSHGLVTVTGYRALPSLLSPIECGLFRKEIPVTQSRRRVLVNRYDDRLNVLIAPTCCQPIHKPPTFVRGFLPHCHQA